MILTLLAASVAATDFTGTWVLNKSKSDFGAMPEQMIPEKVTRVQIHKDGVLSVRSTQVGARGEATSESKFKLDGSESVNKAGQGSYKTVAKVEGDMLVMRTERTMRDLTLVVDEKFTLTAGGKEMIIAATIAGTPMGDIVQKQVFDRASESAVAATPAAAPAPTPAPTPVTTASYTAARVHGTAKPDFNGTWKLNKAKSNFGQLPPEYQPESIARIVKHNEQEAQIATDQQGSQGAMKTDVKVKLDGTESINTLGGAEAKTVAKWDGDSLNLITKRDFGGMALEMAETWTLNPGGRSMDVAMKIGGTPMGDIVVKYVFEKE